ncbi:glycerophosphodiester phosphodiesterase [Paucisalibacillus globulus]|uniref:glycerophosphodiester phosphodiesterase n=1 Tax=Paucisalibacillus globulus TaxID=351095 RepID=UPI000403B121|nr:glycerophosphodiester phosphodiesterase family protein [Paucisalibacillus globulus]
MMVRGIGHRGYPVKYPENTMSSFQATIELGYTHMELDVHLSKDGVPVVMHDHRIDRMTDGTGEIRSYSFKELQEFKVKSVERIPTLEQVLQLAKNRIIVSIELKDTKLYKGIEEKVLKVIEKVDMLEQVYIISFNHQSLANIRKISKKVKIGPLVSKLKRPHFRLINKLDAQYIAVKQDSLNEEDIKKCEEVGIQLVVWTVNSEDRMRFFKQFPSVLVTTDELEKYKRLYFPSPKKVSV